MGAVENIDAEWDQITFRTENSPTLVSELLWHGADLIVEEPAELRAQVVGRILEKEDA
jgi:predicted DNA-binding transcriptional regulator YafY